MKEFKGDPLLSGINIERMSESDLMQVSSIERISFPSPWSLTLFYGELHNPLGRYYVAHLGAQKVVGYVGLLVIQHEGQITTIAVHPDYRGRHIGRALLTHVLSQSVLWGLELVTLEVRESNDVAQALYESFGFTAVGKRPGYYAETGEDAILMNSPPLQSPEFRALLGLPPRKKRWDENDEQ